MNENEVFEEQTTMNDSFEEQQDIPEAEIIEGKDTLGLAIKIAEGVGVAAGIVWGAKTYIPKAVDKIKDYKYEREVRKEFFQKEVEARKAADAEKKAEKKSEKKTISFPFKKKKVEETEEKTEE